MTVSLVSLALPPQLCGVDVVAGGPADGLRGRCFQVTVGP